MRPTRRGVAALVVAALALGMSLRFGQPGLSAIAGPVTIAVLAAAGQVSLAGKPTVERAPPRRGFPGERRTVELDVQGSGIATIADRLPADISGDSTARCSLPATATYEITYDSRGEYELGPIDVTVTDALGLVSKRYSIDETVDVLVYPSVYRLGGPDAFRRALAPEAEDRQAFDRLREYVPGDSLRDVHWKSSAKRDDLLVREFADQRGDRGLTLVAESAEGHADEMAAAAATVALGALESGMAIEIVVPGGTVPAGYGDTHRTKMLELLARTPAGDTEQTSTADILVRADDDGVTVTTEGRKQPFEDITASRDNPLAGEVGS